MKRRSIALFASEFEHWPLMPDAEYALRIPEQRPPGYFECNDICLPTAKERVELGLQQAVDEWREWEEKNFTETARSARFLRIPRGFMLDADRMRKTSGTAEDGSVAAEEAEAKEGGGAGEEDEGVGVQEAKEAGVPSTSGPVEKVTQANNANAGVAGAAATSSSQDPGDGRGDVSSSSPPLSTVAATNAEGQEKEAIQQEGEEQKEGEKEPAAAEGEGGKGNEEQDSNSNDSADDSEIELDVVRRLKGNERKKYVSRALTRAKNKEIPADVLRRVLSYVPDFKQTQAELIDRLNHSTLAISRWKEKIESIGEGGWKDWRKLPFIRPGINVVVPPKHVATVEEAGEHAVLDEEALVTLTFFQRRNSTITACEEYTVLARNTLGDLHRVMYCHTATLVKQEVEAGNLAPEVKEASLAFFFIEGKFYVTNRDETRPDHVDTIIQWLDDPLKDRRRQLCMDPEDAGAIEVLDMENVTFADLDIRMGTRYLYCHLGECEHHWSFTDICLPHKGFSRDAREYPMLVFQKHYRKRRCAVCDARPARFYAIMDPLADDYKIVYCEFCHYQLHYDAEGQLVYDDFEIFPYLHED